MMLRILNKFYYFLTGIRVKAVQTDNENFVGVMGALETLVPEFKVLELSTLYGDSPEDQDCKELAQLLAQYESDKSTKHDYHRVYAALLQGKRGLPLRILEIGLGTNNTNIPSNMGRDGKPGASLRAFRDWGKNFSVYGADIDKDILFSEERISTFFVNQTDTHTLNDLSLHFPAQSFDLVIDDGLHTPWANLNTINFALKLIKPGGYIVIEDILERHLSQWKVFMPLLPANSKLVRCKSATVCIIAA